MPHRLALALLALLETGSLLAGAAAAATVGDRPTPRLPASAAAPAPPHVAAAQAVTAPRPAPRPRPHRAAPAHHRSAHRTVRPTPRRTPVTPVVRHVTAAPLTLMDQAIARIPGYRPGDASWTVTSAFGHWGIADLGTGAIYISPSVPADRMYDVVAHEWSHVLSVRVYGGDVNAATAAMNAWFGGTGLDGAEKAADCMALELGARWTHYTPCLNADWRAGARRLLAHQRL